MGVCTTTRMPLLMEQNEPLDPLPVSVLSPLGQILEPRHLMELILQLRFGIGNQLAQTPTRLSCGISRFNIHG